jgi:hypothetical protein
MKSYPFLLLLLLGDKMNSKEARTLINSSTIRKLLAVISEDDDF